MDLLDQAERVGPPMGAKVSATPPSDFAILSALTFLLANILNRCTSTPVHW
jgi:hypothetical protein